MPQIGAPEILLVAVIALIVFGPRRLPEIARSMGKSLAEFKRQASDLRSEFEAGLDVPEDEKPAPPASRDAEPAPAAAAEPSPTTGGGSEPGDPEKPAPKATGDESPG